MFCIDEMICERFFGKLEETAGGTRIILSNEDRNNQSIHSEFIQVDTK
jgi:hypothetical protein